MSFNNAIDHSELQKCISEMLQQTGSTSRPMIPSDHSFAMRISNNTNNQPINSFQQQQCLGQLQTDHLAQLLVNIQQQRYQQQQSSHSQENYQFFGGLSLDVNSLVEQVVSNQPKSQQPTTQETNRNIFQYEESNNMFTRSSIQQQTVFQSVNQFQSSYEQPMCSNTSPNFPEKTTTSHSNGMEPFEFQSTTSSSSSITPLSFSASSLATKTTNQLKIQLQQTQSQAIHPESINQQLECSPTSLLQQNGVVQGSLKLQMPQQEQSRPQPSYNVDTNMLLDASARSNHQQLQFSPQLQQIPDLYITNTHHMSDMQKQKKKSPNNNNNHLNVDSPNTVPSSSILSVNEGSSPASSMNSSKIEKPQKTRRHSSASSNSSQTVSNSNLMSCSFPESASLTTSPTKSTRKKIEFKKQKLTSEEQFDQNHTQFTPDFMKGVMEKPPQSRPRGRPKKGQEARPNPPPITRVTFYDNCYESVSTLFHNQQPQRQ